MTFYLLYPVALENVIVCLDSVEFWGYNWRLWWCFVIHIALIILLFLTNKSYVVISSACLAHFCISFVYWYISAPPSPRLSPGDMLDLLKWRAHPERINDSLSKLKEIDGSEIVKVGTQSDHQAPDLLPGFRALIVFWFDFGSHVFSWGWEVENVQKRRVILRLCICVSLYKLSYASLLFLVSPGHPGHSFRYSGWKLAKIWTEGVWFTGK